MAIVAELARRIRVLALDADGVLTDGGIYLSGAENEGGGLRRFHVQDGMAVHMLRRAGVEVAIVSGRESGALRARARELGIGEVHTVGPFEKVPAVAGILRRAGADWPEAACLADDLADLALLERVGLPGAVANAVPEVRERAIWRGRVPGGEGAVREFAEDLLRARDEWDDLVEDYVEESRPLGQGPASGEDE